MKKNMYCMIRMDDITPDMDWDKFNRIREIFERYHICPLLGVVPDSKDMDLRYEEPREDFWEIIRSLQKKGWMIAQHGTNHCYATNDSGILRINPFSEFAGLSYDEQLDKLQKGKKILEEHGVISNIFMAPGHTYDKNTLKALSACGFKYVTDGLYKMPYVSEGLLFIPCRLQKYRKIRGLDTICLHSNLMAESDIKELDSFCHNNQQYIIPFDLMDLQKKAVNRTTFVVIYERLVLWIRNGKNKIANSKRLAWYMDYTNDKNGKKKWLKRICYLPLLVVGREK